tara:strand:- start:658 stop:1296 length:639 start_codon:yes stop_codon:yes gene_type:complete
MSSQNNIPPYSITDGKISRQAKISPKKLAPGKAGQVLIAGEDGKFVAGDLPSTTTVVAAEEEVLPPNSVKIGPVSFYDGKGNTTKKVGTGAKAIPQRDSLGNLKAETADKATTADSVPYSGLTGTVPTWNQNTTGNAATATALETARTLGGVSFDGTSNIDLPGVNTTGNQDTTGNAATSTTASNANNFNGQNSSYYLNTGSVIGGETFTGS